jgi:hypothetical protein
LLPALQPERLSTAELTEASQSEPASLGDVVVVVGRVVVVVGRVVVVVAWVVVVVDEVVVTAADAAGALGARGAATSASTPTDVVMAAASQRRRAHR